jgi:hypothetical protein
MVFRICIFFFCLFLIPITVGILLKLIRKNFRIVNKEKIINISWSLILLVICVSNSLILVNLNYPIQSSTIPSPLRDNYPLVYSIYASSSTKSYTLIEGRHTALLPEALGNVTYELSGALNISIDKNNFKTESSNTSACIREIFEKCQAELEIYSLFGTYYFPVNQTTSYISKLNNSYPFGGFQPTLVEKNYSIPWGFGPTYLFNDLTPSYINVTTIAYKSLTNSSIFSFSFDKNTGFLMRATLKLSEGSWVPGLQMDFLTISRFFLVQLIDDQNYFMTAQVLQYIFSGALALVCYVIIRYFFIQYNKKKKDNNDRI